MVRYPITGQSPEVINAQLRLYAVSKDHPEQGHTRSQIEINARLEPQAGQCRLTALEVGLHVTTTLPEWVTSSKAREKLRKQVTASFERLERHEGGHRENALITAQALRSAVLALQPAATCPRLQAAIDMQFQKAQWRLDRQDDQYDVRTRYGERDDPRQVRHELASTQGERIRP